MAVFNFLKKVRQVILQPEHLRNATEPADALVQIITGSLT